MTIEMTHWANSRVPCDGNRGDAGRRMGGRRRARARRPLTATRHRRAPTGGARRPPGCAQPGPVRGRRAGDVLPVRTRRLPVRHAGVLRLGRRGLSGHPGVVPECTGNRPKCYQLRKYGLPPGKPGWIFSGVTSWRNNMARGSRRNSSTCGETADPRQPRKAAATCRPARTTRRRGSTCSACLRRTAGGGHPPSPAIVGELARSWSVPSVRAAKRAVALRCSSSGVAWPDHIATTSVRPWARAAARTGPSR